MTFIFPDNNRGGPLAQGLQTHHAFLCLSPFSILPPPAKRHFWNHPIHDWVILHLSILFLKHQMQILLWTFARSCFAYHLLLKSFRFSFPPQCMLSFAFEPLLLCNQLRTPTSYWSNILFLAIKNIWKYSFYLLAWCFFSFSWAPNVGYPLLILERKECYTDSLGWLNEWLPRVLSPVYQGAD